MLSAAALTLLSNTITPPSMKRFNCTTCDRELPLASFPKMPEGSACTHDREICRRCWHQWLEAQVKSKSFDQISCAQCTTILGKCDRQEGSINVKCQCESCLRHMLTFYPLLFLGQSQIRELATPKVYQKYLDSEFKATLAEDDDFHYCIAPGCKSGQLHEGGNIFTCVTCKSKSCVTCSAAWHEDETCQVYQARVKRRPEDVSSDSGAFRNVRHTLISFVV